MRGQYDLGGRQQARLLTRRQCHRGVGQGRARLHFDLRPDDQDAEVARLMALGATPADIGQGEQTWIVLADPEGNEFCVLSSKEES